jgi:hypothetical protein
MPSHDRVQYQNPIEPFQARAGEVPEFSLKANERHPKFPAADGGDGHEGRFVVKTGRGEGGHGENMGRETACFPSVADAGQIPPLTA